MKKRVLILYTGNSCRSQMAEGLLRNFYGDRFEVFSAGTHPTSINPNAVNVMQEIGIDLSDHKSQSVQEFVGQSFDFIITVCDNAKETCPVFLGEAQKLHWSFYDPAEAKGTEEEKLNVFRQVRDEIAEKFKSYFSDK